MLDDEWIASANCKTMSTDSFISKYIKDADEAAIIFEAFNKVEIDPGRSWQQAETQRFASLFFELYEDEPGVAEIVDKNVCMTCPVIRECFSYGTKNEQDGVWGGVYLLSGEVNQNKNAHKTQDVWLDILSLIKE